MKNEKQQKSSKTYLKIAVACIAGIVLSVAIPISGIMLTSYFHEQSHPAELRHIVVEYNNALYISVLYDQARKQNLPKKITNEMLGGIVGEGKYRGQVSSGMLYKYAVLDVEALVIRKVGDKNMLLKFYSSNNESITGGDVMKMHGVNSANDIQKIKFKGSILKNTMNNELQITDFFNQNSTAKWAKNSLTDSHNVTVVLKNGLLIEGSYFPESNKMLIAGCEFSPKDEVLEFLE